MGIRHSSQRAEAAQTAGSEGTASSSGGLAFRVIIKSRWDLPKELSPRKKVYSHQVVRGGFVGVGAGSPRAGLGQCRFLALGLSEIPSPGPVGGAVGEPSLP